MQYRVGDKVRIREDLQDRNYPREAEPYTLSCVRDMLQYAGKTAVIEDCNYERDTYTIDIDFGCYHWCDSMLEDPWKLESDDVSIQIDMEGFDDLF